MSPTNSRIAAALCAIPVASVAVLPPVAAAVAAVDSASYPTTRYCTVGVPALQPDTLAHVFKTVSDVTHALADTDPHGNKTLASQKSHTPHRWNQSQN